MPTLRESFIVPCDAAVGCDDRIGDWRGLVVERGRTSFTGPCGAAIGVDTAAERAGDCLGLVAGRAVLVGLLAALAEVGIPGAAVLDTAAL